MTNLYFSEKPELIFESDHHGNTVMVSFLTVSRTSHFHRPSVSDFRATLIDRPQMKS